ncbi:MAG: response regulator transcription factor [Flavobacteriaceae bacterium]|nr:response regulator transcription factor [Flavobacteriaceae bacterium]
MLRLVLVDDENNAIKTLQSYIAKYLENATVVGMATSKKDAVKLIDNCHFDLLLLDINLGDGTGFEVLEEVVNKDFSIIFTTAYDEHAIKAFKYSALDYLLKPLNPKEFIEAIQRLDFNTNQKQQINVASAYANSGQKNKIVINSNSEIYFLEFNEIIRLEADINYTDIYLVNGKKITSAKTLKHYQELLSEDVFYRTHQKHLVNMSYIKKFLKEDGGYVQLENGKKIEVSRRKKEDLIKRMSNR